MGSSQADPVKAGKYSDVVGLEIGKSATHAVRLVHGPREIEIVAVGELAAMQMPSSPDDVGELVVPKALTAPYAAFAVNSPQAIMRLVSLKKPPENDEKSALTELFGATHPQDYRVGFAETGSGSPQRSERMYVACGLPDVVAAAVARLLPEARRPAPASLQLASTARLTAFALGPARRNPESFVAHLMVEQELSTVAVFIRGALAAYRQFPVGNHAILSQVAQQFGLSDTLATDLLNENQIDPSAALVPVLTPLFRQVALSTEFVARREGGAISKLYLSGIATGIGHWLRMAESVMRIDVEQWMPFDDCAVRPRAVPRTLVGMQDPYIAAMGAALALMEDA